jgi:hypothetical protein
MALFFLVLGYIEIKPKKCKSIFRHQADQSAKVLGLQPREKIPQKKRKKTGGFLPQTKPIKNNIFLL